MLRGAASAARVRGACVAHAARSRACLPPPPQLESSAVSLRHVPSPRGRISYLPPPPPYLLFSTNFIALHLPSRPTPTPLPPSLLPHHPTPVPPIMPRRRARRRGYWAMRMVQSPQSVTDSDSFPCDSSSSNESIPSFDTSLSSLSSPSCYHLPPTTSLVRHKNMTNLSFPEYAAAELPDLAIFFRTFAPTLSTISSTHSPIPSPRLHRAASSPAPYNRSRPPPHSVSPAHPLPPTFPDAFRHSLSYPSEAPSSSSPDRFLKHCLPPSPPPLPSAHSPSRLSSRALQRRRSAPSPTRRSPRHTTTPRVLPSRRHRHNLNAAPTNPPKPLSIDPDTLEHSFLWENLFRWYSCVVLPTCQCWCRPHRT